MKINASSKILNNQKKSIKVKISPYHLSFKLSSQKSNESPIYDIFSWKLQQSANFNVIENDKIDK